MTSGMKNDWQPVHTHICCRTRPTLIHAHVFILTETESAWPMYTVVTRCVKAVNTWLASLVWLDQFLQSFFETVHVQSEYHVCTPYKFLGSQSSCWGCTHM